MSTSPQTTQAPVVSRQPSAVSKDKDAQVENSLIWVPLSRIVPSKTNPRKQFDGPAMDELVSSIKANGVLQPVLLRTARKATADDVSVFEGSFHRIDESLNAGDAVYDLVAGERRWRAAKEALAMGMRTIPAMVRELSDQQVLEMQIVENLQREDVSALEEAEGFAALLAQMQKDEPKAKKQELVQTLADRIGKSVRHVYNVLSLNDKLAPDAKAALAAGKILPSHAYELVRLDAADQAQIFEDLLSGPEDEAGNREALSVRRLKSWVDDMAEEKMREQELKVKEADPEFRKQQRAEREAEKKAQAQREREWKQRQEKQEQASKENAARRERQVKVATKLVRSCFEKLDQSNAHITFLKAVVCPLALRGALRTDVERKMLAEILGKETPAVTGWQDAGLEKVYEKNYAKFSLPQVMRLILIRAAGVTFDAWSGTEQQFAQLQTLARDLGVDVGTVSQAAIGKPATKGSAKNAQGEPPAAARKAASPRSNGGLKSASPTGKAKKPAAKVAAKKVVAKKKAGRK